MVLRVLVLACVALACKHPAPGPKQAEPAMTAQQILERMESTYANAKSYADRGTATSVFLGPRGHTSALTFMTAFVRPDRFRFEYRDEGDPAKAYVIWLAGGEVRTLWYVDPGKVDVDGDLAMAIGAATGVSKGTAHTVPRLLIPSIGGWNVTALENPAVAGEAVVADRPCWRITGTHRGGEISLFVDRESFLLRRIARRMHISPASGDAFDIDHTTDYEPRLDGPITTAELAPPDPSGATVGARAGSAPPTWLGVGFESGALRVRQVIAGGPAAAAGLRVGDLVLSIDGKPVHALAEVYATVGAVPAGKRVDVAIDRAGAPLTLAVTIALRPDLRTVQRDALLGKPAPAIVLPTLAGGTFELAAHKGKVVVVDFWATWCKPCVKAMPELETWRKELAKKGLVIIGVTNDEPPKVRKFVADHRIGYPIVLDGRNVAWRDYFIGGIPTSIIIDRAGVIRAVELGFGDTTRARATIMQLLK